MDTTREGIGINAKYKDTVFRKLFGENKENALSLYNAINKTSYTDIGNFEYTTLEDVIYMKYKNDLSFLIDKTLSLYEHQSTYNPNMPLRGFLYYADLYRKIIDKTERLYGKTLLKIPRPQYIVFYNGAEKDVSEDRKILRLSEAFYEKNDIGEYEWTATMININCKHNEEIMKSCKILYEYSEFVGKIKEYRKEMELREAIELAINECIKENKLKDFLEKHRREVCNMCLTEFDEKLYEDVVREEGIQEGIQKGRLNEIFSSVEEGDYSIERGAQKAEMGISEFESAMIKAGYKVPAGV